VTSKKPTPTQSGLSSISGEPSNYWVQETPPKKEIALEATALLLAGLGTAVLTVLILFFLGVNFRPLPTHGAALYNAKTETTVTGVVLEARDFPCPVSDGEMESHLTLKTTDAEMIVHLAPGRIMRSQKIVFAPGDQIIVKGSLGRVVGNNDVIAREIVRGQNDYVVRDATGRLVLEQ
jgi:hypothetical protein